MKNALREGGIICSQGECIWLSLDLIRGVLDFSRNLYPSVGYAFTTIPTYPCGQIGFVICSKEANKDLSTPARKWSLEKEGQLLKYYNSEVHKASFVLPQFAKKALFE